MNNDLIKELISTAQHKIGGVFSFTGMVDSINAHVESGSNAWAKFPAVSGALCYLLAQSLVKDRRELLDRIKASGHWDANCEEEEMRMLINCLEI